MEFNRIFFTILINIFFGTVISLNAQITGNGSEPGNTVNNLTYDLLSDIKEMNSTGDLNFSLPVLTVPGRNGLDYTLYLNYNSAIRNKQQASWVGLGFSLQTGSIARTVVERADDQLYNMFNYCFNNTIIPGTKEFNIPYPEGQPGSYAWVNELNGMLFNLEWCHESGTGFDCQYSHNDSWDDYMLHRPEGSVKLIPEYTNAEGRVLFNVTPYEPLKIDYNLVNGEAKYNDIETMTSFIPDFLISNVDGSNAYYNHKSNIRITNGATGPDACDTYRTDITFPISWDINSIVSNDYVDQLPSGFSDNDLGSWINFTYDDATTGNNALNGAYWHNISFGDAVYGKVGPLTPRYFANVLYDYSYVSTIETPTHKAYLITAVRDDYILSKKLIEIKLYRKVSGTEVLIKSIKFNYAANNNDPNQSLWQENEKLKDDCLTLLSVEEFNSNGELSKPPIVFNYSGNPNRFYSDWNIPDTYPSGGTNSKYAISKVQLPEGGTIDYEFESNQYKWFINYFDRINDPYSCFFETCYHSNDEMAGGYRLKSKIIKDGINADKIFLYTYGDGILHNPPILSESDFQPKSASEEYSGKVSYRWSKTTLPDLNGSITIFFTNGTKPQPCTIATPNPPIILEPSESFPDEFIYAAASPTGRMRWYDNSSKRGIIWKKEIKDKDNIIIESERNYYSFSDTISYNETDARWWLREDEVPNKFTWVKKISSQNTKDGVTKVTDFEYNSKNSLVSKITEYNSSDVNFELQTRYTLIDYAFEDPYYGSMLTNHILNLPNFITKYEIEPNPQNIMEANKYVYSKTVSGGKDIWRLNSEYKLLEKDIPKNYSGYSDPDFLLKKSYLYDDFGNIAQEKDANNNITQYKYNLIGSRRIAEIHNANESINSCVDDFNDESIIDSDPLLWTPSGSYSFEDGKLLITGSSRTENRNYSYTNYNLDCLLKIKNDYSNSANWAGISFATTDHSNINNGYLLYYRKNGYLNLFKNGSDVSSVNTGKIPDVWRKISISVNGTNIKVFLDGELKINYTASASIPTGYASLRTNQTDTYFDNFRSYPLGSIVTTTSYDPITMLPKEVIDQNINITMYKYGLDNKLVKTLKLKDGRYSLVSENRCQLSSRVNGLFVNSRPNSFENILYSNASEFSDFSNASGWSTTSYNNTIFNTYFEGETTVRMGSSSGEWVSLYKAGQPSHQIARVDFYPSIDITGLPILLAFGSSSYRFAVQYLPTQNKFRIQIYKNGTWSYPFVFSLDAPKGKWYTVELEKNTNGEAYAYVFPKGEGRINESGYMYYTNGFPADWNATIYSYANGNYYYLANFYSGLPNRTVQYLDGFNRTIQKQNQHLNNSIISFASIINSFGSIVKNIKPYEKDFLTLNRHKFDNDFIDHSDFYYSNLGPYNFHSNTDGYPFIENVYNDPIQRVSMTTYPGLEWRNNHNSKFSYLRNENNFQDYKEYELNKEVYYDEYYNQNGINYSSLNLTYKDKFGNKVCTEVAPGNDGTSLGYSLLTSYEYDILNNLTKVTDPEGKINTYTYNTLNQQIRKQNPDAGVTLNLFDKNGNLRFVQDENHSGNINGVNVHNYSGGIVKSVSGSFTMNIPGTLEANANLLGNLSSTLEIKIIASGSNTTLLTCYAYGAYHNNETKTIFLPKGIYNYQITSNGLSNVRYSISCSDGYDYVFHKYDNFNRQIELGEGYRSSSISTFTQTNAYDISYPSGTTRLSQTFFYDSPSTDALAVGQRNLKGNVSYANSYRLGVLEHTIFYSYDDYGRVEWLVNKWNTGFNTKIKYSYDEQNHIVKKEYLQGTNNIYSFFEYDQPGRLSKVYTDTNPNGTTKVQEAKYTYYANSLVKRVQLGNAQGMDYVYNQRDWISMINHQNLNGIDPNTGQPQDPGRDGFDSGLPQDRFGMVIGYNYKEHIGNVPSLTPQFNGNISWMMYNMYNVPFNGTSLVGYTFSYDQANRMTDANFGYFTTSWLTTYAFNVKNIAYDKSGNITALKTYFSTPSGVLMDDFTYNYTANTNKLSYVTDAASSSVSTTDIDNQSVNNYLYDNNGNFKQDLQNSVGFVINDIFNKPIQIYKTDGTIINYVYDSNGNRVLNTSANKYYVNNSLGLNEAIVDKSNDNIITHNIFGNDMIGQIDRVNTTLTRYYYLKDHLGSIKMRVTSNGAVDGWDDYYPFGSIMNGRSYTSGLNVKYKFTCKERDEETKYDYFGARFYESRLGRWLSIDPLADKYPGWSSFCYVQNNPLGLVDINGLYGVEISERGDVYITSLSAFQGTLLGTFVPNWMRGYFTNDNLFVKDPFAGASFLLTTGISYGLGQAGVEIPGDNISSAGEFFSMGSDYAHSTEIAIEAEHMIINDKSTYKESTNGINMFLTPNWVDKTTPHDQIPSGKYIAVNPEYVKNYGMFPVHLYLHEKRKRNYSKIFQERKRKFQELQKQGIIDRSLLNPYMGSDAIEE